MSRHPIFERMRTDHRRVLERMAALESALPGALAQKAGREGRDALLNETVALLDEQFGTHMAAEDEVLYPALAEALPETRQSLEPLAADHSELRSMLHRLRETLRQPAGAPREEEIAVQIRDLIDLLRIHIRKEEVLVISVAEQVLQPSQIEALDARMSTRTQRETPPAPPKGRPKGVR